MPQDDFISLTIECSAIIGCNPEERITKQNIVIELDIYTNMQTAGQTDDLHQAINYTVFPNLVEQSALGAFRLIETLADHIAKSTLALDSRIEKVRVRIRKPEAMQSTTKGGPSVCITRTQSDTCSQATRLAIVIAGKRCSGKDHTAQHMQAYLCAQGLQVKTVSIGDEVKQLYAQQNPEVVAERLKNDREYKEQHRQGLDALYKQLCEDDNTFPSRGVERIGRHTEQCDVVIITGVRNPDKDYHLPHDCASLNMLVRADDSTRQQRGWSYDNAKDTSSSETAVDEFTQWDLVLDNNSNGSDSVRSLCSTDLYRALRIKAPTMLVKLCGYRTVPDFPRQGIQFRDFQPLWENPDLITLAVSLLTTRIGSTTGHSFTRIIAVESAGFLLGALLAQHLHLPMTLIRKKGKTPPPAISHGCIPSNIAQTSSERASAIDEQFEIFQIELKSDERVLIVDDVLASGATASACVALLQQLGVARDHMALCCLAELPDLHGRNNAGLLGIPVVSLIRFPGK